MMTNSVDILATYFSDVVLNKMRAKSKAQLIASKARIAAYEKTHNTYCVLMNSKREGLALDDALVQRAEESVLNQLQFVASDWNLDECHMLCRHAKFIPKSEPINWFLSYQIFVEELTMLFNCQVGEDGVFNYQLEYFGENVGDVWDYYFDRTPCAVT